MSASPTQGPQGKRPPVVVASVVESIQRGPQTGEDRCHVEACVRRATCAHAVMSKRLRAMRGVARIDGMMIPTFHPSGSSMITSLKGCVPHNVGQRYPFCLEGIRPIERQRLTRTRVWSQTRGRDRQTRSPCEPARARALRRWPRPEESSPHLGTTCSAARRWRGRVSLACTPKGLASKLRLVRRWYGKLPYSASASRGETRLDPPPSPRSRATSSRS